MTRGAEQTTRLPFSRPIAVAEIPLDGLEMTIRADEKECAVLARANNLAAISGLEAQFRVEREGGDRFRVSGTLHAAVRQTCVLSLEEFDQNIQAPIELRFAPRSETPAPAPRRQTPRGGRQADDEGESHHIMTLDEEEPDPIVGGVIDLGAVAAEFLTLNLDPYPRKPGASFAEPEPAAESASVSPFTKLGAVLKKG